MLEQKTLFWLFIGIFAVTAIITLLGITGVIKTILPSAKQKKISFIKAL